MVTVAVQKLEFIVFEPYLIGVKELDIVFMLSIGPFKLVVVSNV